VVSEALRPDSEFMRWAENLDPQRQFVYISVDPSSYATFRAVRAELRKQGIKCGWDPQKNETDFTVTGGVGGPNQPNPQD
jgi:hypothetical protein